MTQDDATAGVEPANGGEQPSGEDHQLGLKERAVFSVILTGVISYLVTLYKNSLAYGLKYWVALSAIFLFFVIAGSIGSKGDGT